MEYTYASLPDRIKAAIIDGLVIIAAMFAISEVFSWFQTIPNIARILAFISVFIGYDPIMTSTYGATVGHTFSNISVKRDKDRTKNLAFHSALLRFILKSSLGWISLLTVTGNTKRKAIHDLAVSSVVLKTNTL